MGSAFRLSVSVVAKCRGAPSIALCDGWDEYRQPTHNAVAVAVLVVIPEGDLLLLFASAVILTLSLSKGEESRKLTPSHHPTDLSNQNLNPGTESPRQNAKPLNQLSLLLQSFFFCHFPPKNRMSSPKTT
jgi:hypothetical protein